MDVKHYDLGMICLRAQHIHKGHESLINTADMMCDRVILLIGSAQESGTERNPFDLSTRIDMIKAIYGDKFIIKPLNDLTNEGDITPDWGRYVLKNVKDKARKYPDVMVYGREPGRFKWFAEEDLVDVTEIVINRGKINISATALRKLLVEDNFDEWMKWVNPKLHKYYDRLRSELLAVEYYAKMLNKTA